MSESLETKTWQDLKDFCNSLNEEQLKTEFKIQVAEDDDKCIVHAYVNDEDILVRKDDSEDFAPRSLYESGGHLPEGEENDFKEEDFNMVIAKGTPVLSCDN